MTANIPQRRMTAPAVEAVRSSQLLQRYQRTRAATKRLVATLSPEDCALQSMPDASPVKWHLAHTTWFFETFILERMTSHVAFDPAFRILFNSYYNAVGRQHPRPRRGLLSRPDLQQVFAYREWVDRRMQGLLASGSCDAETSALMELGIQHEQQHQELILTDLKHLLSCNPLEPSYRGPWPLTSVDAGPPRWYSYSGGLQEFGHDGAGFAFDNEMPRHQACVAPFELASHPVTNSEFAAFIDDGGYRRPELWLSLGWDTAQAQQWDAPLYWSRQGAFYTTFTLHGRVDVDPHAPVTHLSFFEAEAFARWAGARLPTEREWECAARDVPIVGNFQESEVFHPLARRGEVPCDQPSQLFGDVWEWTRSAYEPYPGYLAPQGAIGEYNGKFMCNQYVLRGGSCATPRSHIRPTYRNFFPPEARWQFTGVRLARS